MAEECMTFCARYLVGMDSRLNQADRYMERASVDCNGLLVFKNNGWSVGSSGLRIIKKGGLN